MHVRMKMDEVKELRQVKEKIKKKVYDNIKVNRNLRE